MKVGVKLNQLTSTDHNLKKNIKKTYSVKNILGLILKPWKRPSTMIHNLYFLFYHGTVLL